MPAHAKRCLLFVPQGRSKGSGEYLRCLSLAKRAARRWPDARIVFATKRAQLRLDDDPFERFHLPKDHLGAALQRVLWAVQPDLVVFNNIGKERDLAAVRSAGARSLYIGSIPHYRKRVLERRMLRRLDALWIHPEAHGADTLTPHERTAWQRGGRPPLEFIDSIFEPPDPETTARRLATLGLERDGYVLFTPGGGGWDIDGKPASDLYLEAAVRVAEARDIPCLLVRGPLHQGKHETPRRVTIIDYLPQPEFLGLIESARVVAATGGGMLYQALALGAVCTVAAMPAGDQAVRTRSAAERGVALSSPADSAAISERVIQLLDDPALREAIRGRLAAERPQNEIDRCLDLLAPMVEQGARPCPWWLRPVRPLRP
jgi:hypothetical protein